jgi:ATP-dependent DNA helicase UvrD/PcrA
LQRGGVRAALAWLSVAGAPSGAIPGALVREAARRPKRGMSQSLLDLVAKRRSVDGLGTLADWLEAKDSRREAQKVRELAADVVAVRRAAERSGSTTSSVLGVVRSRIGDGGLDASAEALDQWSHGAIAAHADDLAALAELATLEPSLERFSGWLRAHLTAPRDEVGVTLASVHAVKGREWPHVVVHHATAGLLPHRLAADVEEERRVFHVAVTRCVETVTVVTGLPASPFVAEIEGRAPASRASTDGGRDRGGSLSSVRALGRRAVAPGPGRGRGALAPGAAKAAGRAEPAVETVPAAAGLRFTRLGHDYEISELGDEGAKAVVSGGRAFTTVAYGSTVDRSGMAVVLGHPACAEAVERLRTWRTDRVRATGKPAYTVFDDKTLRALAAALPTSEHGLAAVPGIGPVKLEAYGPELTAMFEELRAASGGG